MAQFTVRNIKENVKTRLKHRAVRLGTRTAARFAGLKFRGELPELCGQPVRAPDFSK